MARAVWSGSVSFGLVNVAVKAFTAVHDHDVHFHQIDRESGSRIGYEKVAKSTGHPVEADDIELGYEISKGYYVRFDPDEIARLRPGSTRRLEVSDFVDLAAIDPVFFEHTYWLAPADDAAEHAYRLLAAALEQSHRVGIATVVMRNKQYLAAVRPLGGALALSTMRFADEVVDVADLDEVPTGGAAPAKKELALRLGATHVATSWEEAPAIVAEATWNRGVNKFICSMGVGDGKLIRKVMAMTAKRGRAVITNIHPANEKSIDISLHELTLTEKQIVGTLYGSANARADIPKILELSSQGLVDLDIMVSKTYPLEGVNEGYDDLRAGVNLRGVLVYPPALASA